MNNGVSVTVTSNGHNLMMDGSWELRILVTDLQVERTLRVKSDLHIGGVMIKLVDELGKMIIS
jgi:kindlin 2